MPLRNETSTEVLKYFFSKFLAASSCNPAQLERRSITYAFNACIPGAIAMRFAISSCNPK